MMNDDCDDDDNDGDDGGDGDDDFFPFFPQKNTIIFNTTKMLQTLKPTGTVRY